MNKKSYILFLNDLEYVGTVYGTDININIAGNSFKTFDIKYNDKIIYSMVCKDIKITEYKDDFEEYRDKDVYRVAIKSL